VDLFTLKSRVVGILLALFLLAVAGLSSPVRASESPAAPDGPVVVRVYYGARENLDMLAKSLDIWEVDHEQAYLLALVSPDRYLQLFQAGYRLEIDAVRTAELNQPHEPLPGQGVDSIPGYPCYRTVEETYAAMDTLAANNSSLASWIDIGDSWDKLTAGGPAGYDIFALDLTNTFTPGPKPTFFLMAEIHAREYVTAETAARFAEYLVSNYGIDPDITWLLDYYHVYIVPMTNPDGRKNAETGILWRKNTDATYGCSYPNYGIDLNRNHSFKWGGDSTYPCDETYQGPSAGSEPETNIIQNFAYPLFPDQRGPGDNDPAPDDTTGIFITLHSYSQLVLWPWGWTYTDAPNHVQLQTLGRKLAYFNAYTPQQSTDLYPTTGTSDDWAYGNMGVAAYTFEMGTSFFQDCNTFNNTIYPNNRNALMYAFKSARHPYLDPLGPESLSVIATLGTVQPGTPVALDTIANDTRYNSSNGTEPTQNIAAAQYTIDDPSWITGTVAYAMTADDGSFDEKIEDVSATVETSCLAPGKHTLFVESKDATNNWGVPGAVFLTVGEGYGVRVNPAGAAQNGESGQTVTYPLTVDNLGNITDTFTVTLTSGWTASAPVEIANLAGCTSAILPVTVEVPGDAVIGMSDTSMVTVTSHADLDQSVTAQLTTRVAGAPPDVAPLAAAQAGDPGQAVVYGLSVTNTNNMTDTFDLVVNSAWVVEAPVTLGPLDPFENTDLAVTVTVPVTASAGAVDVARLQIVSQNPGVPAVTVTLSTTANSVFGLDVTTDSYALDGFPGMLVTYTLHITNTGKTTDTFDVQTLSLWKVSAAASTGSLASGESMTLTVVVSVPVLAPSGTSNTTTVTVTSQGDPGLWQSVVLATTARWNGVWISIVEK
jgi:carboxypeptidase T